MLSPPVGANTTQTVIEQPTANESAQSNSADGTQRDRRRDAKRHK